MDLSGFSTSNGFTNTNAPAATATRTAAPQKSGGILSRIGSSLIQAPSYFLHADIINPTRELAAQATGNKQAFQNAQKAQQQTIGSNLGQATKRLAGNTAQLATGVLAPEAKAGLAAKAVQGAKIGAVAGGGSALANDQNVLKGAGAGALVGGIAAPVASGILSKFLPKGATAEATGQSNSLTNRVAANLQNHLQQTEAATGGFNAGAKLPGAGPAGISLAESQKLSNLADKYQIPTGSPATRLNSLQGKLSDAVQNMHNTIADNNVPITPADRQNILEEFNNRVAAEPNAKELATPANDLADHMNGDTSVLHNGQVLAPAEARALGIDPSGKSPVNDLQSLNGYRQKLDSAINYSRSAATPNPAKEQAYSLLRQTISDHMDNMAPDVSAANKTYGELKSLEAPTLQMNNKLMNTGGGIYNRLLNNNVVKGAESKVAGAGRTLLNKVGGTPAEPATTEATAAPTGILSRLNPQGVAQGAKATTAGIAGAVGNGAISSPQAAQAPNGPLPGLEPTGNETQANNDVLGMNGAPAGGTGTSDQTANSPFNEQSIQAAILNDIQTTGGKNVAALTSLYNTFGKQASAQSTAEKNTTDSLNSALATLSAYNDQLNAAGGGQSGVGKLKEAVGNIPLLGNVGNASATKAVASQSVDVATSIAKALTGGKPSSAQIKSWEKSIPLPTDTAAVAKAKMANITESIQAKLATLGTSQ